MANKRLSKEKQALVLAALCEGAPIEAVARMFKVGTNTITRVIRETGEAFSEYMDANFRDLPCLRIEMDEQWQYVGCHAGRLPKDDETERGDYWLWACIDADTKLVFSHTVGKRDWITGHFFVEDVRKRVSGPVQIATDNMAAYPFHIRNHFGYEGYSYGTETKIFGEPRLPDGTLARLGRNEGVRKMETAERKAIRSFRIRAEKASQPKPTRRTASANPKNARISCKILNSPRDMANIALSPPPPIWERTFFPNDLFPLLSSIINSAWQENEA